MAQVDPYAATAERDDPYASTAETSEGQKDAASTQAVFSGAATGVSPAKKPAIQRGVESFNEGFGISPETRVSDVPKGLSLAVTNPKLLGESLKTMYLNADAAQQKLIDEAYQLQHMSGPRAKANALVVGLYSILPVVGPALYEADKKLQSGDYAGAFGSLAALGTQYLAPKVAGKAKVATVGGEVEGQMGHVGEIKPMGDPMSVKGRRLMQQVTGSGPESTTEPMLEKYRGDVVDTEAANRQKTEDAFREAGERKAKYERELQEHEQKTREATEKGFHDAGEKKTEYTKKLADQKRELEAKHQKATADFEAKKAEIERQNAESKALAERKAKITEARDVESVSLNSDITKLENDVRAEGNRQFNEVRKEVKNQTTDPAELIQSVENARKEILGDYPEGIREFENIMSLKGNAEEMKGIRDDYADAFVLDGAKYDSLNPTQKKYVDDRIAIDQKKLEVDVNENKTVDWGYAQALKTHIETKLRNRATPPQIKRALYAVRDTLVENVMGKMVDEADASRVNPDRVDNPTDENALFAQAKSELPNGTVSQWAMRAQELKAQAGPPLTLKQKWQAARNFWRQYREDFSTPQGPSGSGSPIAKALDADARDPYSTRQPFLNQAVNNSLGNRGVSILRKYGKFGGGAVADRVEAIIAQSKALGEIPKSAGEQKAPPKGPKAVEPPKPPDAPRAEDTAVKYPARPEPPKDVEVDYKPTPEVPTTDELVSKKQRELRNAVISWGKFHTYDLGVIAHSVLAAYTSSSLWPLVADPAFIALRKSFGRVIGKPAVRNWIAQPLPEELKALRNAPESVQNEVRDGMKKFIDEQKRDGNPVKVNLTVAAFLYGRKRPDDADWRQAGEKSPGEMRKDIKDIREKYKQPTSSNPAMPNGPAR